MNAPLESSRAPIYDIDVTAIDGSHHRLDRYRGRTLLIVNVASQCGYTPPYAGLEALYRKYKDRGLVVLGFPCDQFEGQEPGTEAEIAEFCSLTHDVTFPMFAKIQVNGRKTHLLYEYLKSQKRGLLGARIPWNFSKFLVSSAGEVVKRFSAADRPEAIEKDIVALIERQSAVPHL